MIAQHQHFKGGSKTVCTAAVLGAFGIHPSTYHYSGKIHQRLAILRRNGWAVRSRLSRVGKNPTVGSVRSKLAGLGGPVGTRYMVRVRRHAMLLSQCGATLVDTNPRKRDRRRVIALHAVYPGRCGKSSSVSEINRLRKA